MFNTAIFAAIGVFSGLFLLTASSIGITPKDGEQFRPAYVAKKIESDQKKRFLIAKSEGRIPQEATLIAKGTQNWQVFSSPEEEKEGGEREKLPENFSFSNGLFSLIEEIFSQK